MHLTRTLSSSPRPAPTISPLSSTMFPRPATLVPNFTVLNQSGQTLDLHEFRGKVLVMTFVYTRCTLSDFCPRMSQNFARDRQVPPVRPQTLRRRPTCSPSASTPPTTPPLSSRVTVPPYTGRYTERDLRSTGTSRPPPSPNSRKMEQFFDLGVTPGPNGILQHSLATLVIGKDGKVAAFYPTNDWTVAERPRQNQSRRPNARQGTSSAPPWQNQQSSSASSHSAGFYFETKLHPAGIEHAPHCGALANTENPKRRMLWMHFAALRPHQRAHHRNYPRLHLPRQRHRDGITPCWFSAIALLSIICVSSAPQLQRPPARTLRRMLCRNAHAPSRYRPPRLPRIVFYGTGQGQPPSSLAGSASPSHLRLPPAGTPQAQALHGAAVIGRLLFLPERSSSALCVRSFIMPSRTGSKSKSRRLICQLFVEPLRQQSPPPAIPHHSKRKAIR